jgi:hypothetical protein
VKEEKQQARKREAKEEEGEAERYVISSGDLMRDRENQFLIILIHQNLPPLEYKRHLNRLTTKP